MGVERVEARQARHVAIDRRALPGFFNSAHGIVDEYVRCDIVPQSVENIFFAKSSQVGAAIRRAPGVGHVVVVVSRRRRTVGIGFLGKAMEEVPRIGGRDGGGSGLVGCGRLAAGQVAAAVVAVANGSGGVGTVVRVGASGDLDFGITFADKARERVVCKRALAAAVLRHADEIAECVIRIRRDVSQAAGIFGNLGYAAKAVDRALAFFASGIGGRDGVVGVQGGSDRAVLQSDGGRAPQSVIRGGGVAPGGFAAVSGGRAAARGIVSVVGSAESIIGYHGIIGVLRIGVQLGLRSAAETVEQHRADDILRSVHLGGGGQAGGAVVRPTGLAGIGEVLFRGAPEVGVVVRDGRDLAVFVGGGGQHAAGAVPRKRLGHADRLRDAGTGGKCVSTGGGKPAIRKCGLTAVHIRGDIQVPRVIVGEMGG